MAAPDDSCSLAVAITALPFSESSIDLTAATVAGNDPSEPLVNEGSGQLFRTVWYQYTPPTDQRVHLNVSNADVAICVFTGACGSLTEIASWGPDLTVDLESGVVYRIMFGTFASGNEVFDFTMDETPIPSNQLMSTALNLQALRYEETFNLTGVEDNGSSRDLWFKYTAKPGEAVVSFLGYQGSGATDPNVAVFSGDVSLYNPTSYLSAVSFGNSRLQVPVTPGETYYFRIRTTNASPQTHDVIVSGAASPLMAWVPRGYIVVNSDTDGFPAAVIDPTTGLVKGFRPGFVAGETGDVLRNGKVLLNVTDGGTGFRLYSRTLHLLKSIDEIGNIGSGNKVDTFYAIAFDGSDRFIRTIDEYGDVVDEYGALPSASLVTLVAVNPDETIAYLTEGLAIGSGGGKVLAWDLVNDVQLSDLAAGVTNYNLFGSGVSPGGILVLPDGSVLVAYWRTNLADSHIRRYSSAGALLNTYTFDAGDLVDRIGHDPDGDGETFYVWHKPSFGLGEFSIIRVSDGEVLSTIEGAEIQDGYAFKLDADFTDREFGHYYSCPFIVVAQDSFLLDQTIPCCPEDPMPCECPPAGGGSSPSDNPIPTSTGPIQPIDLPIGPADLLSDEYWTAQCDGGGLVPTAADPVDAESWAA